ncbi:MAG: hypothetical protein CL878_03335 [Dehalococcoidia bacterium]|nr:hypothetical protein [Dehalococcoidia bacterium]
MSRRRRPRRQRGGATSSRQAQRPQAQQSFLRHLVTHRAVPYVLIVLLSVLLYANTLPNEFVSDDADVIPNHRLVREPWNLPAIFTSGYRPAGETGLYRPLTVWTFALNYGFNSLYGFALFNPVSFHLVNLLLHAAVGCALYRFVAVLDLPRWPRLATALLFVAHPIHTEAVDATVGRADVLVALFGLLFLLWHHERRHPLLAATAFLLALWSKESAIAFLAVMVVQDTLYPQQPFRWPLLRYGVYGAAVGLWWLLRSTVTVSSSASAFESFLDNPLFNASLTERMLTAARVQLDYLRLQLVPVGLSSDYSYNQIPIISTPADPRAVAFVLVLIAALLVAWLLRRTHPIVALSMLGYGALFAPTSNVLLPIGTIMGERLAYIPSLFSCLLLGYGLWRLSQRRHWWGLAALLVLIGSYSVLTFARNRTWSNAETFYQAQLTSAPQSAKSHYNVGTILQRKEEYQGALEHYEQTLDIYPEAADPHYNIGNILRLTGADPEQVAQAYRQATEKDPRYSSYWSAHVNLAATLLSLQQIDEAHEVLAKLETQEPPNAKLPLLYLRLAAVTSGATITVPRLDAGIDAYTKGDFPAAIPDLQEAVQTESLPTSVQRTLLRMLAYAHEFSGDAGQASEYRRRADALAPSTTRAP